MLVGTPKRRDFLSSHGAVGGISGRSHRIPVLRASDIVAGFGVVLSRLDVRSLVALVRHCKSLIS
jgi:hypothetical protein